MALGLMVCGRDELTYDKIAIDLSFAGAWRNWPYRSEFAQVGTDLKNGTDGIWVMTHAGERNRVWNFYWDVSGRTVLIRPRSQWEDTPLDADFAAELIPGEVPAAGWHHLADLFLERFDR